MLPSGRLSRLETPTLPSLYGGTLKPLGWLGNTDELGSRPQRAIEFPNSLYSGDRPACSLRMVEGQPMSFMYDKSRRINEVVAYVVVDEGV
jgi:hypothetical protein